MYSEEIGLSGAGRAERHRPRPNVRVTSHHHSMPNVNDTTSRDEQPVGQADWGIARLITQPKIGQDVAPPSHAVNNEDRESVKALTPTPDPIILCASGLLLLTTAITIMESSPLPIVAIDYHLLTAREIKLCAFIYQCCYLFAVFGVMVVKQRFAQHDRLRLRRGEHNIGEHFGALLKIFPLPLILPLIWSSNNSFAFLAGSFTTLTLLYIISLYPIPNGSSSYHRRGLAHPQPIGLEATNFPLDTHKSSSVEAVKSLDHRLERSNTPDSLMSYDFDTSGSASEFLLSSPRWGQEEWDLILAPPGPWISTPISDRAQLISLTPGDASLVDLSSTNPVSLSDYWDLFVGVHRPTSIRLAMKSPRSTATNTLKRFEREAEIWRGLDHPNILPFLGIIEKDHRFYLASPLLPQGDLLRFLQDRSKFAVESPPGPKLDPYLRFNERRAVRDTAAGLNYLHSLNIIHGDLKAQNVLLTDDDRAQICDFGLASVLDNTVTTGLRGVGSLRWQSPELLQDEPKTKQSDVYAFGMTISEILTGKIPFSHIDAQSAVVEAVVLKNERPRCDPLSRGEVDYQPLWNIATRCWTKLSSDRPTINQVFKELDPAAA